MSESHVIPFPISKPSFIDDLSDEEVASLSDEEIKGLSNHERHKVAARLWAANELWPEGDPRRQKLEWIAERAGVTDRTLRRWRKDPEWLSMLKDERIRVRSALDDLPLMHPRPRMLLLQEMAYDPKTSDALKLKIAQEFDRVAERMRNPDEEKELKGVYERTESKILNLLGPYLNKPPGSRIR